MQAPLSVRERKDPRFSWTVNTDPTKLDRMYVRLLGRGGDAMLTEEVKWLCVTHKSFDHGRRGFNDRLAFLGRRIVMLHASLALVNAQNRTRAASKARRGEDTTDPFAHPALEGLQGLTSETLLDLVHKRRIAPIASRGGLGEVMRWLPMRPDNLGGSGIESVLSEALFAIVGAVALQRGGEEAARITRERILGQLGIV
ncbi:MAG: hypothetical protein M1817_000535 [Caeruleum heppii]|nr:MAG: hypothetical protein M1817_000535 [Caeruleum heppii]